MVALDLGGKIRRSLDPHLWIGPRSRATKDELSLDLVVAELSKAQALQLLLVLGLTPALLWTREV